MRLTTLRTLLALSVCLGATLLTAQAPKPTISLDEVFSTTDIINARLSPDGTAAVIETEAPDWQNNVYRNDLWLWTAASGLRPLTHSGTEEDPKWSPDGKYIAFISDRQLDSDSADSSSGDDAANIDRPSRLWIIPLAGGEALPLYSQKLDVHAFAWSTDSRSIFFATTSPLTEDEKQEQKKEWKDVIRWREQNRGDLLLKIDVAPALARALEVPHASKVTKAEDKTDLPLMPAHTSKIASSDLAIAEIAPAPDGKSIAFNTTSVHHRVEDPSDFEIFVVSTEGGKVRQLTHNQGIETQLHWSANSHTLFFAVSAGAGYIEGPYRDVQGRLYRMDVSSEKVERLGSSFIGSWANFALLPDGREIATGQKGTQTQVYLVDGDNATQLPGLTGTYANIQSSTGSNAILVRYSTFNKPTQVYLATDPLRPDQLKQLTNLNPIFTERAQPEYEPYTWKADDGRTVEGMLIFPPGKKNAKHLRMLTLIHGGPEDADGNRFEADWYDWAAYAADNGWLVFRPNYLGSTGYGDDFMLAISPHLVSAPGREILSGVDALVKDGYADPDHLAIGGYSYGGYMTNWLITQTTRFRSAVTGAGAVEHAANWGNDDLTYDDAWYLGGTPWQNPEIYQSEAALFQFNKVKTPVHLVQGGADVRVSYLEGVTMERALQTLHIPHTFLVFPGEGHSLDKNPWHGYIKVRDELKWIDKYDK
ncbi:MAG: S9 family peptidase [Acidobacteriota bacterium]|nr:S9 family peptidase [Acidobacteriota bacterium]